MVWAYSSVGLEHSPDKGKVSGSSPLRPTIFFYTSSLKGDVAQLGERCPCKAEVSGSIPLISTSLICLYKAFSFGRNWPPVFGDEFLTYVFFVSMDRSILFDK